MINQAIIDLENFTKHCQELGEIYTSEEELLNNLSCYKVTGTTIANFEKNKKEFQKKIKTLLN